MQQYSPLAVSAQFNELRGELMELADSLGQDQHWVLPKTSDYYACFAHYATSNEVSKRKIEIKEGAEIGDVDYAMVGTQLEFLVNAAIVRSIWGLLRDKVPETTGVFVGEIARAGGWRPDAVWWHCCWLAKQGLLRVR